MLSSGSQRARAAQLKPGTQGDVVWPNIIDELNRAAAEGFEYVSLLHRSAPDERKTTNGEAVYEILMGRCSDGSPSHQPEKVQLYERILAGCHLHPGQIRDGPATRDPRSAGGSFAWPDTDTFSGPMRRWVPLEPFRYLFAVPVVAAADDVHRGGEAVHELKVCELVRAEPEDYADLTAVEPFTPVGAHGPLRSCPSSRGSQGWARRLRILLTWMTGHR